MSDARRSRVPNDEAERRSRADDASSRPLSVAETTMAAPPHALGPDPAKPQPAAASGSAEARGLPQHSLGATGPHRAVEVECVRPSVLERNLVSLGPRNTDLARQIREAEPAALEWTTAADGSRVASLNGRALASKHAPRREAETFADAIDYREKAVVAIIGFGLGYHITAVCERLKRTGFAAVLEPDLGLLRAVLSEIDLSESLRHSNILVFSGAENSAAHAERFAGTEGFLIQGVHIVEHAPSKARIAEVRVPAQAAADGAEIAEGSPVSPVREFSARLTELVRIGRVTASTNLARSAHTIRSIFRNARRYVAGETLAPLAGTAKGRLGVVVSAGPSLRRNLHLLADPGVRERCLIVATPTVLKPLLADGIRPHFVAALDWHHISTRFFEGLTADDVRDTTFVLDPQVNPAVPAHYPGPVRVISAPHLDLVLGPIARDTGRLPACATVAHLCYQIARYLGCDPVALIGQDLGFTDGVYYARGTAIDEVWSPELNPFDTLENLEWTRIVRHRAHLVRRRDIHDRSIFTDGQMEAYLQRFEFFFAEDERRGLRTIDASEGGVRKQCTEVATLRDTLDRFAREPLPEIPVPARALDANRLRKARTRIEEVIDHVRIIRQSSHRACDLLEQLTGARPRREAEDTLWKSLDRERDKVSRRLDILALLDGFSTLGAFKRAKADRRIEYARDIDEVGRQKLQFERDIVNVRWIGEGAEEYLRLLEELSHRLGLPADLEQRGLSADGDAIEDEATVAAHSDGALGRALGEAEAAVEVRAAFLVPVDPSRGGLGTPRSLAEPLAGRPVIQWTLERLGRSREASSIILLAPEGFDVERLIDRRRIALPIEIHRTQGSPLRAAHAAVAAGRLWSDASWRGGIAGLTAYDEVLSPESMLPAMERFGITAAVVVAPDWPLVFVDGQSGCDALVRRHRLKPDMLRLVFNQSPPGLSGVLVERSLMEEFRQGGRHATIGARLAYEPTRAQQDPISKDLCVQIEQPVRRSLVRAVFDTPRSMTRMRRAIEPLLSGLDAEASQRALDALDARAIVDLLEHQLYDTVPYFTPQHLMVELNTGRQGSGASSPHRHGSLQRPVMTERRFARLVEQVGESRDCVISFTGAGDPLFHPELPHFIRMAKESGVRGVHVRTELLAPTEAIDAMVEAGVDVVSVELDAETPETYRRMHGVDRFRQVIDNIQRVFLARTHLSGPNDAAGFAVPWIVPRLQRRVETLEDIEAFFDRWQHTLGTPVLEGAPPHDPSPEMPADGLASARAPSRVMFREMLRRMQVLADGSVPLSELDLRGERIFAHVERAPLLQIWRDLVARRKQIRRDHGETHPDLRTRIP